MFKKNIFVYLDGSLFSMEVQYLCIRQSCLQFEYPVKKKWKLVPRDYKVDYTRAFEPTPIWLNITKFESTAGDCFIAHDCEVDEDEITPHIINQLELGNLEYWSS